MKKVILLLLISILLVGCSNNSKKSVINNIISKYNKSSGYNLIGNLEITNNDEVYNYDVEVGYLKKDKYKVILTNKSNNYVQIILKNDDGVYVLTPSLNKSFKFNSDWPYNNSQIYLYDALINDIKSDKNIEFNNSSNNYIITTSVNYPNNNKLVNQKITFSNKLKLKKISVYDKNGVSNMNLVVKNISLSPKFNDDYFSLDNYINDSDESNNTKKSSKTSSLGDVIYPLVIPSGTKLASEDRVKKDSGERVIMSYEGDKSFLLVEETVDVFNEFTVIPSLGEPFQLMDTLGVMTDNSLSWSSGNTDYYLVSDVMNSEELIEVAQSIVGVISMK